MAGDSVLLGVMSLSSVTLSKAFIGQNKVYRTDKSLLSTEDKPQINPI